MTDKLTCGAHHVGLAVPDLAAAEGFFTEALGWDVVGVVPDYPATFVSDGAIVVTLWQVPEPVRAAAFDRRANIGLHHLALGVKDEAVLARAFDRIAAYPGVTIEFAPEPMAPGAAMRHFIFAMPGGIRIELATRAA